MTKRQLNILNAISEGIERAEQTITVETKTREVLTALKRGKLTKIDEIAEAYTRIRYLSKTLSDTEYQAYMQSL